MLRVSPQDAPYPQTIYTNAPAATISLRRFRPPSIASWSTHDAIDQWIFVLETARHKRSPSSRYGCMTTSCCSAPFPMFRDVAVLFRYLFPKITSQITDKTLVSHKKSLLIYLNTKLHAWQVSDPRWSFLPASASTTRSLFRYK